MQSKEGIWSIRCVFAVTDFSGGTFLAYEIAVVDIKISIQIVRTAIIVSLVLMAFEL